MDHYTPESFTLTQSVGFAVNKARNLLAAELDAALKDLGITTQQMGILMSMRGGETQTPFGRARVSHVCLNDDVVEGLECLDVPAFSVQYHPEAAPGPHDSRYLFDAFRELMDAEA